MKLSVLILAIAFPVLIAGCGSEQGSGPLVMPEVKNVEAFKPGADIKETKEPLPNERVAVINDTVVDVFRDPDTKSERVTQALFNQPVSVLEKREAWLKVKVVDGYTGWIKEKFAEADFSSIKPQGHKYRAVVTNRTQKIYSGTKNSMTLKETVMGTELYVRNKTDNRYEVSLPGNTVGWISSSGTIQLPLESRIPKTSVNDFVATVNKFKGTVYLWGGVSAYGGLDCSGLTYICSRINGIELQRDADQQFKQGTVVALEAVRQGDLVFFSTNEDLKDISHVGIYISNNQFIHASKSKGSVTVNSLTEDYYKKRLAGIRRFF